MEITQVKMLIDGVTLHGATSEEGRVYVLTQDGTYIGEGQTVGQKFSVQVNRKYPGGTILGIVGESPDGSRGTPFYFQIEPLATIYVEWNGLKSITGNLEYPIGSNPKLYYTVTATTEEGQVICIQDSIADFTLNFQKEYTNNEIITIEATRSDLIKTQPVTIQAPFLEKIHATREWTLEEGVADRVDSSELPGIISLALRDTDPSAFLLKSYLVERISNPAIIAMDFVDGFYIKKTFVGDTMVFEKTNIKRAEILLTKENRVQMNTAGILFSVYEKSNPQLSFFFKSRIGESEILDEGIYIFEEIFSGQTTEIVVSNKRYTAIHNPRAKFFNNLLGVKTQTNAEATVKIYDTLWGLVTEQHVVPDNCFILLKLDRKLLIPGAEYNVVIVDDYTGHKTNLIAFYGDYQEPPQQ